ncbi:MAG: methyl-accepting chemotaxis protein [Brevinema sp.]
MEKKTNFLKNMIYSLRIRMFVLMLSIGSVIYVVTSTLTHNNEVSTLTIARQFYLDQLKVLIADQYFSTRITFTPQQTADLKYRFEILLDPGVVFDYAVSSYSEEGKRSVEEFLQVFELAKEAQKYPGDNQRLTEIYQASLSYPSLELYNITIDAISKGVARIETNKYILFLTLLIVFLIAYLFLRSLAVRVGSITEVAKRLINSDETLQLTERLDFQSHDETVYIRDNFNIFLNKLEHYTLLLLNNARGLIYQITQMFAASKGWTLETQVMRHSTERISRQMADQILSVNQSAATLEEMERTLDIIFNNISRQSAAMTQAATTLEEMGRQVDGVAQISSDTANLATRLTEVANKGNEAVDASIVSIKDVAEYSSQILKLLQLISGIAKQTNLLAMNASIEAAHAGEAGRGFAIVAEEIRRLSETTNKNAKEIRTVVDTMVEKIGNSVEQARIAGEDLQQINNYSENVAERIAQLNNMMQQQNVATHEMISTVEGLVNLAQEIKISMEEQQHGLHDYSNTIKDLKENFGEVKSTLDGHMSSVSNLLVILTDMGIRIQIQKKIMDSVGEVFQLYKVNTTQQVSDQYIQESQDQLFLEEQEKFHGEHKLD